MFSVEGGALLLSGVIRSVLLDTEYGESFFSDGEPRAEWDDRFCVLSRGVRCFSVA